MKPLLFELSAAPGLADALCRDLAGEKGEQSCRRFPDEESYVRFLTPVAGRHVVLLCTLDRPDPKIPPLLFAAAAARDQGAASVGLVAPYLAYMRQDKAFQPGEAVTSTAFACLISSHFDWLATVDPHLHRHTCLSDLYSIPAKAASAATSIGGWVGSQVRDPVIIGPDEESLQWVEAIAGAVGARAVVLRKVRTGDFAVTIDGEPLRHVGEGNVVIVDDIASSARTLIEAVGLVRQTLGVAPACVVVHPVFAGDAYESLRQSGARVIASTNTVGHVSNAIDIAAPLARVAVELLRSAAGGTPA